MRPGRTRIAPGVLRARLIVVLTALMTLVVLMFGLATLSAFDRAVAPELAQRTRLIGAILRDEIQRTLDLGIPLDALGGIETHIEAAMADFDDVRRITVLRGETEVLAEVRRDEAPSLLQRSGLGEITGIVPGTATFPILVGNEPVGEIRIEGSPQFVEIRLRDVFLDVSVLAIVALLLGVELALAVAAASVWKPYGRVLHLLEEQASGRFLHRIRVAGVSGVRRAAIRLNEQADDLARRARALPPGLRAALEERMPGRLPAAAPRRLHYSDFNDVRLALFLFATGAEITASFLPVYARAASRPDWLSPELSAAAPLGVFLVAVAALSPFGGAIARRFGARRVFVGSVVPVALALVAMGLTGSLAGVALCRGLIGAFYALATIACQEYGLRAGRADDTTRSSAAFVGMIFGGVFCGSVLGGVIGGRFGFPSALFVGAALVLASGLLARGAMRGSAGDPVVGPAAPAARGASAAGNRPLFAALLLCIAIPMSATTAILVWYLTPLGLAEAGFEPGDTARVVMTYYLASTVIGPLAAGLSAGRAGAALPVTAGALLTGGVLLAFRAFDGYLVMLATLCGCGVGHALIRAPMTSLAVRLAGGSGRRMSAFRLAERLGALAGLLASALVVSRHPPPYAVAALGVATLVGAGLFFLAVVPALRRPRAQGEEDHASTAEPYATTQRLVTSTTGGNT